MFNQKSVRFTFTLFCSVLFIACFSLNLGCNKSKSAQSPIVNRVGLIYTGPHELINQIVKGFREGLSSELPTGSFEILERHANGDKTQFSSTVDAVLSQRPSLLATITTPISQIALKNKPQNVPLIFLGVTDPIGAGLIKTLEIPETCTGVSDLAPFEAILSFIRETRPNAKRIGMPYSPEEQPAVFARDQVKRLGTKFNFTVDARPVTSQDELPSLLNTLAGSSDVLLIGSDNGMFEAAPLIVQTALNVNKPVYAGDSTSIKAGAIGGLTIDYYQVGREGARLAARVLRGEKAGQVPVSVMKEGVLELNKDTSSRLGIKFPGATVSKAKKIYP